MESAAATSNRVSALGRFISCDSWQTSQNTVHLTEVVRHVVQMVLWLFKYAES